MKLAQLRRECVERLTKEEVDRPFYVTDILLTRALGVAKPLLITKYDEEVPPRVCEGIFAQVARRLVREPLSYIIGEAEFYGRPFSVGPGCLIPRPETELLVEAMLKLAPSSGCFADWCTGSGCIGITLALERPGLTGIGVDCSAAALEYAGENIRRHAVGGRFKLLQNSEPSEAAVEPGSLDFITANPPYIPAAEMSGLMPDVRDYEPHEALDGGENGTELYVKFFAAFPRFLRDGGYLGVETAGDEQCVLLNKMVPDCFVPADKVYDYGGKLRHLIWRKRTS